MPFFRAGSSAIAATGFNFRAFDFPGRSGGSAIYRSQRYCPQMAKAKTALAPHAAIEAFIGCLRLHYCRSDSSGLKEEEEEDKDRE